MTKGPIAIQFVDFDFLDDFEEVDGKLVVWPGGKVAVRPRSAKGALPAGTVHWGAPFEGEQEKGDRMLAFVCPCGCGEHDFIVASQRSPDEGRRAWWWDGNMEKPTITPSIFRTGAPCKWHGFLTKGEWTVA